MLPLQRFATPHNYHTPLSCCPISRISAKLFYNECSYLAKVLWMAFIMDGVGASSVRASPLWSEPQKYENHIYIVHRAAVPKLCLSPYVAGRSDWRWLHSDSGSHGSSRWLWVGGYSGYGGYRGYVGVLGGLWWIVSASGTFWAKNTVASSYQKWASALILVGELSQSGFFENEMKWHGMHHTGCPNWWRN